MKLALAQTRVWTDRPSDNLEHMKAVLSRKEAEAADMVVFPRLALSGRLSDKALSRPGLAAQYEKVWSDFLKFSSEHPRVAIASSVLRWSEGGQAREEVFAARDGALLYAAPGAVGGCAAPPEPWPLLDIAGEKIRLLAGDELWPGAAAGLDVLLTLSDRPFLGEPFAPGPVAPGGFWRVNVSRVGGEGVHIYEGATAVFSREGALKGWLRGFDEGLATLDTAALALPDAAADKMEADAALYEALVCGLRDFMRGAGAQRAVVGLSGGLDSALTATLAVEALGAENVLTVAMPSEFNAPESLNLARELAGKLKVNFLTIPISAIKEAFDRSLMLLPGGDEKNAQLADENIQARIRAVLLMYIANREDRLLLATGNKSEGAMGYCTLYGDSCGAIAPIGDVYKTRLYELARWLNREKEMIPKGIIARAPSAELRPGQTDQDSLPPYEVLDDILSRHLEGGQSGAAIAKEGGHSPMTVAWVLSGYKKAAFKRDQEPFSLVVSKCPLGGFDWR